MTEIESTVETTGPVVRKLHVSVPADRVSAVFDKMYAKLKRETRLKGFRQGKVPRAILERQFGDQVTQDVIADLIESTCMEAVEKHGLDIVAAPRLLEHEYVPGGALTFDARLELRPEFELGAYKGLKVSRRTVRVEDAHVDAALDSVRQRMAVLEAVEDRSSVEPGDIITFDMYGFSNDEPVPGTSGEGIQLEVGSGRFPEEFEKQLSGVRLDAKTPITVEFPDDHQDGDLAGKTVRFDVTVTAIKAKVLPELDDGFAAELGIENCETLSDLRGHIRTDLAARNRQDAERRVRNDLIGRIVDAHEFDLPETLLEETFSGFLHEMGLHEQPEAEQLEKMREALMPQAGKQVTAGFVLDAVAAAEQLAVSREELEAVLRRRLANAGADADKLRQHYRQPAAVAELRTGLLREKAVAKIVEMTIIEDEEIDESQVADQG